MDSPSEQQLPTTLASQEIRCLAGHRLIVPSPFKIVSDMGPLIPSTFYGVRILLNSNDTEELLFAR